MDDQVDLTTVALVAGGLVLIAVVFGTLHGQRLRARGQRVPAAITSNVAFGWVLIVVITGVLISQALSEH